MKDKIGIFLPGANGDIMQATSVLKYKDVLWPDKDIVWFCSAPNNEILKYNDAILEIRHWPHGWGLPERCLLENPSAIADGKPLWADFSTLKDSNNHLDQGHKHLFESTKDLERGYFPAPWMMSVEQRHGIDYPNVSRKVFGADPSWEWHPYLGFLDGEEKAVADFCYGLPYKKTVMLETSFYSGKSPWDDDLIRETIALCRQKLGSCNFIFACLEDNSRFFDVGVVSCSQFTVRQTALVNNYCDLFIGVSSGISQAVNCWGNKPTPKIQYCGSFTMSSISIANGPFELVTTDPPSLNHREQFKTKLSDTLDKI